PYYNLLVVPFVGTIITFQTHSETQPSLAIFFPFSSFSIDDLTLLFHNFTLTFSHGIATHLFAHCNHLKHLENLRNFERATGERYVISKGLSEVTVPISVS